MPVPRVKKAKQHKPPREIRAISRKCRECGRYGSVGPEQGCPWCGKPYGRLELGLDLAPGTRPDPSTGPEFRT